MIINHIEQQLLDKWILWLRLGLISGILSLTICILISAFVIVHPLIIIMTVIPSIVCMTFMYIVLVFVHGYKDSIYKINPKISSVVVDENPLLGNEAL